MVTVVVQPNGGSTPAAAKQAVAVTVELLKPAEVTVLAMLIVHVTWNPAPVGKAGGSHCVAAGAVAAADAELAATNPPIASMASAVTTIVAIVARRRMVLVCKTSPNVFMRVDRSAVRIGRRRSEDGTRTSLEVTWGQSIDGSFKDLEVNTARERTSEECSLKYSSVY